MYSKNDYRYYLEHRMVEDNYLAHYGVKGMKWKQHLKRKFDQNFNVYKDTKSFDNLYSRGEATSKYVGIESKKNPSRYLEVAKHKYKDGGRETTIYFSPTKKEHYKRLGRVRLSTTSEGSAISIDASKKKRYKKNNAREFASAVGMPAHVAKYTAHEATGNLYKKKRKKK